MSSLFLTISMLPSHLTIEMSIALCIGMKMRIVAFETPINSVGRELASEFTFEGIQPNHNGRPYYLTCSKVGNLRLGWSIIDRKHNVKRSIRSGLDPSLT